MQSISPTAVAARAPPPMHARYCLTTARPRLSRAGNTAALLRARCGGAVEPAVARDQDGEVEVLAAAEELELLEEEAMGGGDEGRRPTDYDRRAHIFEASSRVFRAIKQRRDGAEEAAVATTAGDGPAAAPGE